MTLVASAEEVRVVRVEDERTELAQGALDLIAASFPPHDRQPIDQIAMEIAERRIGLLTSYDFHLFAAIGADERVLGVSAGVYLGGVNAGFVTYLAVRPEAREQQLGRRLRTRLVDAFRADAGKVEWEELAWVVGEVRRESPWLRRLVRDRSVIPFDLRYFHPGVDTDGPDEEWVLYRQPVGDPREELSSQEVGQLLYAIWRRAYRVRWPLQRPGFAAMLEQLEERDTVGFLPELLGEREDGG
jgi:ribosomal protein S18 acetylase RimI-like enzyme